MLTFQGFPYWYFCHQTTSPFWFGKWVVPFSFVYRFLRYSTFLTLDFRESKRSHFKLPKIKSWSTSPFLSSRSLKPTQIVLLKLSTQMESSGQVGGSSQNQKFITEPDKFLLDGKTPLVGVCYSRPLARALTGSCHLLQSGQQHTGTVNPFLPTGRQYLAMWQSARPPHATIPHIHLHPSISQTDQTSGPAAFSSSLIQTPSGLCIQLHIPWLVPQQPQSKSRLLSPDEVLHQTPGAGTDTAWKRKDVQSPLHSWLLHRTL